MASKKPKNRRKPLPQGTHPIKPYKKYGEELSKVLATSKKLVKKGDDNSLDRAEKLLQGQTKNFPKSSEIFFLLAEIYEKRGDLKSARYYFDESLKAYSKNSWVKYRIACIDTREGKYPSAIKELRKIADEEGLKELKIKAIDDLIRIDTRMSGREREARLKEILSIDPEHVYAKVELIKIMINRDEKDKAYIIMQHGTNYTR